MCVLDLAEDGEGCQHMCDAGQVLVVSEDPDAPGWICVDNWNGERECQGEVISECPDVITSTSTTDSISDTTTTEPNQDYCADDISVSLAFNPLGSCSCENHTWVAPDCKSAYFCNDYPNSEKGCLLVSVLFTVCYKIM